MSAVEPTSPTTAKSGLGSGGRLALALGAFAGLAIVGLLGGWLFIHLETTSWRGDLTAASLSVSLSNEVLEDASCRPTGRGPRTWSCRVYAGDESGNSARVDYTVVDRGDSCWSASIGRVVGFTTNGSPAPMLSSCVTALQRADDHSALR